MALDPKKWKDVKPKVKPKPKRKPRKKKET